MGDYDRAMVADALYNLADAITSGELDGAGRYTPSALVEQADMLIEAYNADAAGVHTATQPPAVGVDVSEGFVVAPNYRGYANLGTGAYLLLHSHADDDAELCIVPASESEKQGREVGDLSQDGPEEVSADRMAVRIRFENVAGLDALEQQLRLLRKVHFNAALRTGGGA